MLLSESAHKQFFCLTTLLVYTPQEIEVRHKVLRMVEDLLNISIIKGQVIGDRQWKMKRMENRRKMETVREMED